jgi:hypothetical protein
MRSAAAVMETTDTLDRTNAETPADQATVAAESAGESLTANAVSAADDASTSALRRLSGWYLLGLALQVFLWFLVFLGIVVAIGVGGHLTEFRYVGF